MNFAFKAFSEAFYMLPYPSLYRAGKKGNFIIAVSNTHSISLTAVSYTVIGSLLNGDAVLWVTLLFINF